MNQLPSGSLVNHPAFGRGVVEYSKGETTLVRFSNRIEECLSSELTLLRSATNDYLEGRVAPTSVVVLRLLGETIRSVNDAWGVFSPSRIDLYPHQLWVARKVTETWPARWVVADDVGLGKTIEAGMILWRLFQLGLIRRLLILCPASLVPQWQERLFAMFDIRTAQYDPRQDTDRVDFWKLNRYVVASFHTLREDREGRHERMLQTDPWDLVIVDEAHHLNSDEAAGMTLAHKLIKKLQDAEQLQSLIFFTGTPHRGKHFGFLALMSLVRPDLFDAREAVEDQLALLPQALIRNNKYHVTNLRGERLFRKPEIITIPYHYNRSESFFYDMMTEFIASGRAYATRLDGSQGRAVMLVLIALQKLASSSVAAVGSALHKRLTKLRDALQQGRRAATKASELLESYADDEDSYNLIVEDEISKLTLELMENECDRLTELIAAADDVVTETKIETIVASLRELPPRESVLFFTEYKVTQALLISALWKDFGEESVTFINGDNALPSVLSPDGTRRALRESRQSAKDRFNLGEVRFLVSTEAAGEGVDLHERCSRLIHVDLPWNPMRLHQRVGRLNRIGQRDVVKVMLFQNPDTVESRIWDLLNEKLERIRRSINAVTEEPEDLHQLVLGIAGPGILDTVFSQAASVPRERLGEWFNQETGQMGGEDAVLVVQELLGHAQHFDFSQMSDRVPRLDLPDLAAFFRLTLRQNHRQVTEKVGMLNFTTPIAWQKRVGVKHRYDDVHFDRKLPSTKKGTILGVGSRLFDAALDQSCQLDDTYASATQDPHKRTLLVFRCFDRLTGNAAQPKVIIAGVVCDGKVLKLLKDWEVLLMLNEMASVVKPPGEADPLPNAVAPGKGEILSEAEALVRESFHLLDLPFRQPDLELLGIVTGIEQFAKAHRIR